MIAERGEFGIKVKRQTMSPQPIDTHSMMILRKSADKTQNHEEVNSGFISVRQDYAIPAATGTSSSRENGTNIEQLVIENASTIEGGELVLTNINTQKKSGSPDPQRKSPRKNSQKGMKKTKLSQGSQDCNSATGSAFRQQPWLSTKQQVTSSRHNIKLNHKRQTSSTSGLFDNSVERLNPVAQYSKNQKGLIVSSFQSGKRTVSMRKHLDQSIVREKKLKKKSEREKSI